MSVPERSWAWPTWVAFLSLFGPPTLAIAAEQILRRKAQDIPENRKLFPARLIGGKRSSGDLRLIVLHSTESSGTAASVASWFQNPSSGGSTQLIVGPDGVFRSVEDLQVPAGAGGANLDGLHLEIVGRASWSRDEWKRNSPRALALASRVLARWSRLYGIPLKYLDAEALKKDPKARGVTTHKDVSLAFKKSDHTDPGAGFPLDEVIQGAMALA